MKTPRDILLRRHASANEKLDAVRRDAVQAAADMTRRQPSVRGFNVAAAIWPVFAAPCRELLWRPRRVWAGFAAVWLALVAVNLATSDHSPAAARANGKLPPAGFFFGWEQQEKLMADVMLQAPPPQADRPRPTPPRPRSERQRSWRIA
jgi:hypothetical protein